MDAEAERLRALHGYRIPDTAPDERFDRLTALAAALFSAPVAQICLVDNTRQWFKSKIGPDLPRGISRDLAFRAHTLSIGRDAVMVVEDASAAPRFADSPLVTGDGGVRFYAAAALTTRDGHNLGTLCVLDTEPRARPTAEALEQLQSLARMTVDVIEATRAQHALEDSNRFMRLAESMAHVGHWRYEIASRRVDWSEEIYRIHGFDPGAFTPTLETAVSHYHPDDRPIVETKVEQSIATGRGYETQLRIVRPDGQIRYVASKCECELDGSGATVALFGMLQDITHHVEALERARQSEARYRLFAENTTDVISRMARSGKILYLSPSIKSITGYGPEELVGLNTRMFMHPDDVEATSATFRDMGLGLTETRPIRYRIRHRDGHWIWLEANPKLVTGTDGSLEFIDVVRDVTRRVAMEEALRAAQEEARTAAAVKAEFLANMSHELRTPLTSILGFSDLLRPQIQALPKALRYLDRVGAASHALLAIVNDIMDFSKLEAGQVEIAPHPVALAPFLESAIGLLAPQAEAKGLRLRLALDPSLPSHVQMDDARVRQVLLNLLSNAVKFTESGEVVVRLGRVPGRQTLRCEVEDTGRGVPPDRLDRLFQRFSQVDASTTRSFGGTGLGLAICKGLVEAMGGAVGVRSLLGHGSTFWFELPLLPPEDQSQASTESPSQTSATELTGLRLLVVDDNPANLELVRLIGAAVGMAVTEADGGEAAINLCQNRAFDLILMDLRMPGLGGHASARAIKAAAGPNGATPILAFTADTHEAPGAPAWAEVFDGHVAKPIIAGPFLEKIWQATQKA